MRNPFTGLQYDMRYKTNVRVKVGDLQARLVLDKRDMVERGEHYCMSTRHTDARSGCGKRATTLMLVSWARDGYSWVCYMCPSCAHVETWRSSQSTGMWEAREITERDMLVVSNGTYVLPTPRPLCDADIECDFRSQ